MMDKLYIAKYPVHAALAQKSENKPTRGWEATDPQFRHRAVMALFGDLVDKSARKSANILFRVDALPAKPPFFLVQSQIKPRDLPDLLVRECTVPALNSGHYVRFRIAVNAVRRNTSAHGKHGVTPVPFDDDQEAPATWTRMTPWLQNKLDGALSDVTIVNHQREVLGVTRMGRKSGRVVQVDTVDGVARVHDPNTLADIIVNGVGRAKSYGCGLLSVDVIS